MPATRRAPRVLVLLDTNAMFGAGSEDLLSAATVDVIKALAKHHWVKPEWVLPDMVWHERLHQLFDIAERCIPTLDRVARLTGKAPLAVSQTIRDDISARAAKQRTALGMGLRVLDCRALDLERLRMDAVYRRPPFAAGEKEKGFRDALIIETLFQLIAEMGAGIDNARVFMVSEDRGVEEAVTARSPHEHVRVVRDLEALRGALTAMEAAQDEALVARVQENARSLFFTKGDQTSLYYREGVTKAIQERFAKELLAKPKGAVRRTNGTWRISEPEFIKRTSRRIFWKNTVTVECQSFATHFAPRPVPWNALPWPAAEPSSAQGYLGLPGLAQSGGYFEGSAFGTPPSRPPSIVSTEHAGGTQWLSGLEVQERVMAKGGTRFEVAWNAECTEDEALEDAKLGEITFVGTSWRPADA